ncbi:hypothetical protein H9P43_005357 [Blastocladiella emersonii ATCC 22665]|nr:hypothetical protein H9P43_005357 [Blastocladiella emersonii ATCC 22665]
MNLDTLPTEVLLAVASWLAPADTRAVRGACRSLRSALTAAALRSVTVYSAAHLLSVLAALVAAGCPRALHAVTVSDTHAVRAQLYGVPLDDPYAAPAAARGLTWDGVPWAEFAALHTVILEGVSPTAAGAWLAGIAQPLLAAPIPGLDTLALRFLDVGSTHALLDVLALTQAAEGVTDLALNVMGVMDSASGVPSDDEDAGEDSDDSGWDSGLDSPLTPTPTSETPQMDRDLAVATVLARLTTLRLRHCDLHRRAVARLLAATPRLAHLDLHQSLHHAPADDVRLAAAHAPHVRRVTIKLDAPPASGEGVEEELVSALARLPNLVHLTLAYDTCDGEEVDGAKIAADLAAACPSLAALDLVEEVPVADSDAGTCAAPPSTTVALAGSHRLAKRRSWARLNAAAAGAAGAKGGMHPIAVTRRSQSCQSPMAELEALQAGLRRMDMRSGSGGMAREDLFAFDLGNWGDEVGV